MTGEQSLSPEELDAIALRAELRRVTAERDEAREQRNRAQLTWDDEHDARLKAEAERDRLRAALSTLNAACDDLTIHLLSSRGVLVTEPFAAACNAARAALEPQP